MVEQTRQRVAAVLGPERASKRVRLGGMDYLSAFADGWFDLAAALGVYHSAGTRQKWELAVAEAARVLKTGSLLLVNRFTPEVDLTGEGVRPIEASWASRRGCPTGGVCSWRRTCWTRRLPARAPPPCAQRRSESRASRDGAGVG